jgi:hypothetical protein
MEERPTPRDAVHTPRRIPLADSRTASPRPLPPCRSLRASLGLVDTSVARDTPSPFVSRAASASWPCSVVESVAPGHRCRCTRALSFLGFVPLRGPSVMRGPATCISSFHPPGLRRIQARSASSVRPSNRGRSRCSWRALAIDIEPSRETTRRLTGASLAHRRSGDEDLVHRGLNATRRWSRGRARHGRNPSGSSPPRRLRANPCASVGASGVCPEPKFTMLAHRLPSWGS